LRKGCVSIENVEKKTYGVGAKITNKSEDCVKVAKYRGQKEGKPKKRLDRTGSAQQQKIEGGACGPTKWAGEPTRSKCP